MAEQKYMQVASLLEKRIRHGDYLLREIPGSHELAAEIGVSYITARKALKVLLNQGILRREPYGRVEVNHARRRRKSQLQIAMLAQAFQSPIVERYRAGLQRACEQMEISMRPVLFTHWSDPFVMEAINNFDGVFIYPDETEPMPPALLTRLQQLSPPVVLFNMRQPGVPMVCNGCSNFNGLLDHLASLGHRRIDCCDMSYAGWVGATPSIDAWQAWMDQRGFLGRVHRITQSDPYTAPQDIAADWMRKQIKAGAIDATALFCLSATVAMGVLTACREYGVVVGRDLSVCCISDECVAGHLQPPVTCTRDADAVPMLINCLELMKAGKGWKGPLEIEQSAPELLIRASTGPAPSQTGSVNVHKTIGSGAEERTGG